MNEFKIFRQIQIPKFVVDPIIANESFLQIVDFLQCCRKNFDAWFSELIHKKIVTDDHNWVNYTVYKQNVVNNFPWHNELGVGGSKQIMLGSGAGIIWISGDVDAGGELDILHDDQIQQFQFEPGTVFVFPIDTFHRVEAYHGNRPRISLNFTFEEV